MNTADLLSKETASLSGKYVIVDMTGEGEGAGLSFEEEKSSLAEVGINIEEQLFVELFDDGKIKLMFYDEEMEDTCSIDGNKLLLSDAHNFGITIADNKLTLLYEDGTKMVFEK